MNRQSLWYNRLIVPGASVARSGICLLALLSCVACRDTSSSDLIGISSSVQSAEASKDAIEEAFRDIPKMILLERRVAVGEVTRQLNSWSTRQAPEPDWKPSDLIEGIPSPLRKSFWGTQLASMQFGEPHCDYLYQCQRMHAIVEWVLARPYRDPLFAPWLEAKKAELAQEEGTRLEQALKLFDWTIRNIMMEGDAKSIETLPTNPQLPMDDNAAGYTQLPWQTAISARGDAVARARVFLQLAMQADLHPCWVALPGITDDSYRLWAIGIPVGKQLYLLEPRLGIPLPGPDQKGVATLEQAQQDPAILRRAKIAELFDYPVAAPDVARAFLVLDLEPASLSRPMQKMESALTGNLRLRLAADIDRWKQQLQMAAPDRAIRLGSLPWMAQQYAIDLRERLKDVTAFTARYMSRVGLYADDTPVTRARLAHLSGQFDGNLDGDGALGRYMALRIDDETLDRLPFDIELQKSLLIRRLPNEENDAFQRRISLYQGLYRQSKLEGSLFLSMAQFDLGNYETSQSWADRWMLKQEGTERWHPICWYLIARNLEQSGKPQEAVDWYRKSPSAQEAGNRIRARLVNP